MAKPTLRTFTIGFALSLWIDKDIKAESLEAALISAKAMTLNTIIKNFNSSSMNKFNYDIIQVYDPELLTKYGM